MTPQQFVNFSFREQRDQGVVNCQFLRDDRTVRHGITRRRRRQPVVGLGQQIAAAVGVNGLQRRMKGGHRQGKKQQPSAESSSQ